MRCSGFDISLIEWENDRGRTTEYESAHAAMVVAPCFDTSLMKWPRHASENESACPAPALTSVHALRVAID